MIYRLQISKAGQTIFSHDIVLAPNVSFADQFRSAMDTFRENFPGVSLLDDDVSLNLLKVD